MYEASIHKSKTNTPHSPPPKWRNTMLTLNSYRVKSYCQTQYAQLYTKTQENIESKMTKKILKSSSQNHKYWNTKLE